MSSIMTTTLLPTKKRLTQLYASIQQRLQSLNDNLSQEMVHQTLWVDFQQDVKYLSKIAISFADALEEERTVVCKIEAFIKNLQLTNNELIEQQKQLIGRIQQAQKGKYELGISLQNLAISKNRQIEENIKDHSQKNIQMKKVYEQNYQKSLQQINYLKIQIQNISLSQKLLQQQLSLKETEIQLAQLSINDLVNEKKALQAIATIYSPKKQNSCLYYQFQQRKSTETKSRRRYNSLLDDLVQSQILYQPYLSSQMFKSTETIQETIEDYQNQQDNLEVESHIQVRQKRSKAISVNITEQNFLQISHKSIQTDGEQGFWSKFHKNMKNKIIQRRIKR